MGLTLRFAALVSLLTLFSPSPAAASSILAWTYDGSSDGCSTCQATASFEQLSATSLKISFENTSTDWLAGANLLTGFGFDTAGELSDLTISDQQIEGDKVWKLVGGVGSGTWEVALASKNGINQGLDNQSASNNSGWVILTWSSPGLLGALTIENSVAKFVAVGPGGGGIHAAGTPAGLLLPAQPVSVWEPSGPLLFGAAAGMLVRRRRNRFERSGEPMV